jgi:hypothetical protein
VGVVGDGKLRKGRFDKLIEAPCHGQWNGSLQRRMGTSSRGMCPGALLAYRFGRKLILSFRIEGFAVEDANQSCESPLVGFEM